MGAHKPGEIDWITFVGSGEPTLHSRIGYLIQSGKNMTDIPVAVITNGALLLLPDVREDLIGADVIMPSLDAGTEKLYRRINRPHQLVPYQEYIKGLVTFQKERPGKMWVEVMLVRGLNDTEATLNDIADVLARVKPDEIHLNLPTRPPVETWVQPPDEEGLLRARAILGEQVWGVTPIEGEFDLSGYDNVVDAVIGIITRHPMRREKLEQTLSHWAPGEVQAAILELETNGRARVVERYGVRFWSAARSFYPEDKE